MMSLPQRLSPLKCNDGDLPCVLKVRTFYILVIMYLLCINYVFMHYFVFIMYAGGIELGLDGGIDFNNVAAFLT